MFAKIATGLLKIREMGWIIVVCEECGKTKQDVVLLAKWHSSIVLLCSVAKTWVEAVRLSASTVPSAVVLNFGYG